MANVRIVYNNVFDDATLVCPDAYPSMPADNLQSAGRALTARLKQVASVVDPSASNKVITDSVSGITAVTITAWFCRTGDLSGDANLLVLETDASAAGKYIALRSTASTDTVFARFHNGTGDADTGNKTLTIDTWHCVQVTWEAGGVVTLYLDGSAAATANPSSDESLTGTGATTLRLDVGNQNYKLARLRIDARVLDSSELTALRNHRYVSDSALIERFTFDSTMTGERGTVLSTDSVTYSTGPSAHATANMTQIKGAWSSGQVVSALAIARNNLTSSSTVKLMLYSDTAYGTAVYTGTAVAPYAAARTGDYLNYSMYITPTTAQSFAIEVQNNGTAWDASRIVLGQYFQPSVNADIGMSLSFRDTGFKARTEGGATIAEAGEIYRVMSARLGRLTESERTTMSELLYSAGATREVFVSMVPGNSNSQREIDYSMCGMFESPSLEHPSYQNYAVGFTVEET